MAEHARLGGGADRALGREAEDAGRHVVGVVHEVDLVRAEHDHQVHGPEVDRPAGAVVGRGAGRRLLVGGRSVDGREALEEQLGPGDEPEDLAGTALQRGVLDRHGLVLDLEVVVLLHEVGVLLRGGAQRGQHGPLDEGEHGSLHWCPYIPKEGASIA